jgi:nitrogen fixation/metabolism regulation signal transduction histidine kinase
MRHRVSIEGQVALLAVLLVAASLALAFLFHRLTGDWAATVVFTLGAAVPLAIWSARRWAGPVGRLLQALNDGFTSLRDGDFSISLAAGRRDELGALVGNYNAVGDVLRRERQDLFQRELLLDTVIQSTPLALVLTNAAGHVIYSNTVARQMFGQGAKLEGLVFDTLVDETPASLQEAVRGGHDTLFSLEGADGEQEVLHLSQRRFVLNGRDHRLYLFKRLTRELTRQEVATWKKVIRVISHELNNSLAPISSLAHSGRRIAQDPDPARLDSIFATIEERAAHLKAFLEGYAQFAKLPAPRLQGVPWEPFIASLRQTVTFNGPASVPERNGWFDPAQVQQVLINLLKNAHESGSASADVELAVADDGRMIRLQVLDRGGGMSETVLNNALLPFYSTKRSGTGLGLSLCREIAEAHGGRISLANRPEGGLAVSVWLPARTG